MVSQKSCDQKSAAPNFHICCNCVCNTFDKKFTVDPSQFFSIEPNIKYIDKKGWSFIDKIKRA